MWRKVSAVVLPFTPHQPLGDGKYCIIPERVAHQCVSKISTAELLTVKGYNYRWSSLGAPSTVIHLDPAF